MTRKKVKLSYINDNAARKATFNKRKKGIIKKVRELTILCDIKACAIISNPFDSQTEVWPDKEGAKQVIQMYQSASAIDKNKNVNQESFIMQRVGKAKEQLMRQNHDNREKQLTIEMFQYMQDKDLPDHLTAEELKDFEKLIDKKLEEIDDKIYSLS